MCFDVLFVTCTCRPAKRHRHQDASPQVNGSKLADDDSVLAAFEAPAVEDGRQAAATALAQHQQQPSQAEQQQQQPRVSQPHMSSLPRLPPRPSKRGQAQSQLPQDHMPAPQVPTQSQQPAAPHMTQWQPHQLAELVMQSLQLPLPPPQPRSERAQPSVPPIPRQQQQQQQQSLTAEQQAASQQQQQQQQLSAVAELLELEPKHWGALAPQTQDERLWQPRRRIDPQRLAETRVAAADEQSAHWTGDESRILETGLAQFPASASPVERWAKCGLVFC